MCQNILHAFADKTQTVHLAVPCIIFGCKFSMVLLGKKTRYFMHVTSCARQQLFDCEFVEYGMKRTENCKSQSKFTDFSDGKTLLTIIPETNP